MIQQQTIVKVMDNSGIKVVKCLKILRLKTKKVKLGNFGIVVVQKLRNKVKNLFKFKKGQIFRALIIQLNKKIIKKNGLSILFKTNYIILLNKHNLPIGNRVFGIVPKNITNIKSIKFAVLSSGLI